MLIQTKTINVDYTVLNLLFISLTSKDVIKPQLAFYNFANHCPQVFVVFFPHLRFLFQKLTMCVQLRLLCTRKENSFPHFHTQFGFSRLSSKTMNGFIFTAGILQEFVAVAAHSKTFQTSLLMGMVPILAWATLLACDIGCRENRRRGEATIKNSVLRLRSSPHLTCCIYSYDEKHKQRNSSLSDVR